MLNAHWPLRTQRVEPIAIQHSRHAFVISDRAQPATPPSGKGKRKVVDIPDRRRSANHGVKARSRGGQVDVMIMQPRPQGAAPRIDDTFPPMRMQTSDIGDSIACDTHIAQRAACKLRLPDQHLASPPCPQYIAAIGFPV